MRFVSPVMVSLVALMTVSLSSCEKERQLVTTKVKKLLLSQSVGRFEQVTEVEGRKIIESDPRLVIVDFYTDT